jgi:DNA polymerase III subunit epsilon
MGVDTEATGIDTTTERIVTWCAVALMPTGHIDADHEMVNPGIPIPQGATDVHGITDAMVQRSGNPPAESLWRFVDRLADAVKGGIPLVGMNLSYDFTLLNHECRRHGIPTVEEAAGLPLRPVIDAYVLDKHADPYRKGSRKLSAPDQATDLCRHYRVRHDGAHDALADAIAAARVCYRIVNTFDEIGQLPLQRLHDAQVLWKAGQAAGLQAHFRKKDPQATVDPCWPYCAGH